MSSFPLLVKTELSNWVMNRADFARELIESLKNNSKVVSRRETAEGAFVLSGVDSRL